MRAPENKKHTAHRVLSQAAELCEVYAAQPQRADALLETVLNKTDSQTRRRCQRLFLGVVRWKPLLEQALMELVARRPRPRVWAVMQVAAFEILDAEDPEATVPRVVDHAVSYVRTSMSTGESRLVNAVLRKVPEQLERLQSPAMPAAVRYAVPQWLYARWQPGLWGWPSGSPPPRPLIYAGAQKKHRHRLIGNPPAGPIFTWQIPRIGKLSQST